MAARTVPARRPAGPGADERAEDEVQGGRLTRARLRLLLLLPSTTYRTGAFVRAAARLRETVDLVTATDGDLALPDDGPRGALTVPFDGAAGLPALLAYAHRHPIDAAVAVDDHGLELAAALAQALGLRHSPPEAIARTLDKLAQRQALARAGLPVPGFSTPAGVGGLAPPLVVKPRRGRASRGVVRHETAEGLDRLDESFLIEEYVPWSAEVAVEGLLTRTGFLNVLAVFDKPDPLEGPTFAETLYVTPSRLPPPVLSRLCALSAAACRALGLSAGPVHVELRLDDAGAPWLVEVNPRTIGGRCSGALAFPGGLTLEDVVLRDALGLPLPEPADLVPAEAAAVVMLPVPAAGRLAAVEGLDAALAVPGVTSVEITVPIGAEVVPLPEGDRYAGFVFARAATPQEAEAAAREAWSRLTLTVVAGPTG